MDTMDGYGWTALMCAACRGFLNAVNYLLDCGADRKVTDRLGMSALLLANRNGHSDITERLLMMNEREEDKSETIPEIAESSGFHCGTCRRTFEDDDREAHVSSTVHQFNERDERRSTRMIRYHIPESNVGYKIMVKDGWDGERGLGPFGLGMKFPPKTVLKRDRQGLGGKKLKARITHFGPGDVTAVRRQPSSSTADHRLRFGTIARRERVRHEDRQRQMEVDLRRQFNELE